MSPQWIQVGIKYFLSNFPVVMTVFSLTLASIVFFSKKNTKFNAIFLANLFFFAVGLSGIWGFVLHAFYPVMSAKFIGWHNSPFQFEVAVANLGIGVSGIFAVGASRAYRTATTIFTTCFLWGAAYGHVIQMLKVGNFAPGNAGSIFYNDLILPLLLILLLLTQKKERRW